MSHGFPRPLDLPVGIVELLTLAVAEAAKAAVRRYHRPVRVRRGSTLRPGLRTPLWNELRRLLRREMRVHGDRALLGRHIGVPRQRIHEFLRGGTAMPDAERTLELLGWLARRPAARPRRRRAG